ncbi:MAG TPA: hypothetical protein VKB88_40200 [Bryobacteraceae bacterium]|nr:hypothetical protein [Bryobacteraceae bacterium]
MSATTCREEASRAAIAPPTNLLLAPLTGSTADLTLRPMEPRSIKGSFLSEIIECFLSRNLSFSSVLAHLNQANAAERYRKFRRRDQSLECSKGAQEIGPS